MIAILGLKTEEIKKLLQNHNEKNNICEIANDNADGQVIVSGIKESINLLQVFLKKKN